MSFVLLSVISVFAFADTLPTHPSPCGLAGSISNRIKDCQNWQASAIAGFPWVLVTHTLGGIQVWRDNTTGLLWGDMLAEIIENVDGSGRSYWNGLFSFKKARSICGESRFQKYNGHIAEVSWSLPKIDAFVTASAHGFQNILPNTFPRFFWSATPEEVENKDKEGWPSQNGLGFLFSDTGLGGMVERDAKSRAYPVRCIGF